MLQISENKKYFMKDGEPFFWLADTAWLMFYMLDEEEIYTYLRNRAEKGYNVILGILVHDSGNFTEFNKDGSLDIEDQTYWEKIDRVIEMAASMDIYMGLLPAWGSVVKKGILNLDNVQSYAEFLGKRYQHCSNLVWIMGGDIRGQEYIELYRKEAEILKSYNPERLISYHPFGRTSSSMWFQEENWLDFNMFQSGHRRYDQLQLGEWDDAIGNEEFFGEDSWRYVERDLSHSLLKPTLDGEPSYEGIPQGLHNPHNLYWEEWDVRRYAYWSVFAGAAGHTYGNNAIIQFYQDKDKKGAYGVRETWQEAMHHSGGSQLKYLKELMTGVDYTQGQPRDEMLLYGQKERYHRVSCFAGEKYVLCYTYMGNQFMLDLSDYADQKMEAYWMNPADGTYSYAGMVTGEEKLLVTPVRRKGIANDWVYVLKAV